MIKPVARAFEELDALFGGLDVLINNAGISIRQPFMDITPEQWRTVSSVNLNGVFYVAQQAARRMLAGNGGVILNMGSTNGLMGYHYYADYNAGESRRDRTEPLDGARTGADRSASMPSAPASS